MVNKEKKELIILIVLITALAGSWLYARRGKDTPVAQGDAAVSGTAVSRDVVKQTAPRQPEYVIPDLRYIGRENRDPLDSAVLDETIQKAGAAPQQAPVAAAFSRDRFTVSAVVWGSDHPQAIINNEIMNVGDSLEGAKIVGIDKKGVHLEYEGEEILLEVI